MKQLRYDDEWGRALEAGHDEYMEALWDSVENEDWKEDISGESFCGCDTCERRASWTYLLMHAIEGHEDGSLQLVDVKEGEHDE